MSSVSELIRAVARLSGYRLNCYCTSSDFGGFAHEQGFLAEALVQLATPEPDYHDNPALWQEWRDRTTEALNLARAFTASLTGAA